MKLAKVPMADMPLKYISFMDAAIKCEMNIALNVDFNAILV